jgi:hypothetical protein
VIEWSKGVSRVHAIREPAASSTASDDVIAISPLGAEHHQAMADERWDHC